MYGDAGWYGLWRMATDGTETARLGLLPGAKPVLHAVVGRLRKHMYQDSETDQLRAACDVIKHGCLHASANKKRPVEFFHGPRAALSVASVYASRGPRSLSVEPRGYE